MKLKNNWKRFWTLNRHSSAGFTLVELIVVIAILAILAGVGIPVYSGYITKANQQADMTLISEVANALSLGYYSGKVTAGGYVVLQAGAAPVATGDGVADAMAAAFGTGWNAADNKAMQLKTDWNVEYTQSSFAGNEAKLTGQVETLTNILSGFLTTSGQQSLGVNFPDFVSGLGVDMSEADKVADAAVLYIANGTKSLSADQQAQIAGKFANCANVNEAFGMWSSVGDIYGSNIMGAAATYAMFIGYIQYEDSLNGNTALMDSLETELARVQVPNGADPATAVTAVMQAFQPVMGQLGVNQATGKTPNWDEYWKNHSGADLNAFIDAMGVASDSKDLVVDTIKDGNMNYATDSAINDLFAAYSNGGVMIQIKADGTLVMPELD